MILLDTNVISEMMKTASLIHRAPLVPGVSKLDQAVHLSENYRIAQPVLCAVP